MNYPNHQDTGAWGYAKGCFIVFGIPTLMFYGAQWNPLIGQYGDDPARAGYLFILIPYWILLLRVWIYRQKKLERSWDLGVLFSEHFREEEKETIRNKYASLDPLKSLSSYLVFRNLLDDCPELAEEIERREQKKKDGVSRSVAAQRQYAVLKNTGRKMRAQATKGEIVALEDELKEIRTELAKRQ